jgi:hypothetical protein
LKLEAVTAELRPRSDWEAVDLGLALVRRDFRKVFAAWWLGMLPMLLLSSPLLIFGFPGWFLVLFWWWVPVASRMALFHLSRHLFGEVPSAADWWRELPRACFRRFGYRMLWARLSHWRPLTMAVEDLEGLRGKAYRNRCRVLMRRGDSTLVMLAMWKCGLTLWLALSLFCLLVLLLSQAAQDEWSLAFQMFFSGGNLVLPPSGKAAILLSLMLGISLTDLFVTGAGFGIYVNHRTWIEGWDVELAFRRMATRIARVVAALALAFLLIPNAGAEEGDKERIERILKDPAFEVHTEKEVRWLPADWWNFNFNSPSAGSGGSFGWVLTLIQVSGIVLLVALLAWLIYRFRHVFQRGGGGGAAPARAKARVVMGMEVGEETLPEDITGAALRAWREGRAQEALGLLYRGAISWMIGDGGVGIAESDTESDCLRRVREAGLRQTQYFEGLTDVWMRLAYARQLPGDPVVEQLCAQWPFRKGGLP